MEKKFKLGVIGAGFMSTAIVKGAIKCGAVSADKIIVSDVNEAALTKMAENGVSITLDTREVVNNAEFTLFAVKPQSLSEVLPIICNCDCKKFISIMAGVKKDRIKNAIKNSKVARCMPNTPCSIGFGAVGLDVSDFDNQDDAKFIKGVLSSFAQVVEVSEDKMHAVTGVSGSSPAYYYMFVKGIIDAGVENGLDYETAKILAVATMVGAGEMIKRNPDKSIDELINAVCSKGGTTIEAVKVYEQSGLTCITEKAVKACVDRSKELENL